MAEPIAADLRLRVSGWDTPKFNMWMDGIHPHRRLSADEQLSYLLIVGAKLEDPKQLIVPRRLSEVRGAVARLLRYQRRHGTVTSVLAAGGDGALASGQRWVKPSPDVLAKGTRINYLRRISPLVLAIRRSI